MRQNMLNKIDASDTPKYKKNGTIQSRWKSILFRHASFWNMDTL